MKHDFQDTDLAYILNGVGNTVYHLNLERCTLGLQASRSLASHFSSLVSLELGWSNFVPSPTIRDILYNCPRLMDLDVGDVSGKDIADGGPWVCRQLRWLMICLRVGASEQHLQPLVFERLSTLVQLERWTTTMGRPFVNDSNDGVLEFRLGCGLGQSASLYHLSLLELDEGNIPEMGMDKVAWMADNWKLVSWVDSTATNCQILKLALQ
jgi:hypothetical protein